MIKISEIHDVTTISTNNYYFQILKLKDMTVNAKYSSMDNKYIVLEANTSATQKLLALSENKIFEWFLPCESCL